MSYYYTDEQLLNAPGARGGSAQNTWVFWPLAISLAVGALSREWTWLQSIPGSVWGTMLVMGMMGLMFTAASVGAFRAHGERGRRYLLLGWFAMALLLERAHRTPYDQPIDYFTLQMLSSVVTGAIGLFIGLRLGLEGHIVRSLLRRAAAVFACIGVYGFLAGSPPKDEMVSFPSFYVGFPMRLFVLFAFCWYLDRWLISPRWISRSLIGLAAASLPVIVAFHKPIVFSAVVATLAVGFLQIRRGTLGRSLVRIAVLGGVCMSGFVVVDRVQQGQVSERYMDTLYKSFFHATSAEVRGMSWSELWESSSGGRFKLWEIAMVRFEESPLVGTGLGQRLPGSRSGGNVIPLHNQYLDILLSVGLLGTIPVVIGTLLVLSRARRAMRGSDADWALPAFAFVIGIGAYDMGGNSNLFPFVTAFATICMGMVCTANSAPTSDPLAYRGGYETQ